MPRRKLSEFRSKSIINKALELDDYSGRPIDTKMPLPAQLKGLNKNDTFVVKVDQGIKGRFKKGLVVLNVNHAKLPKSIKQLGDKGYHWLIVEPMVPHDDTEEQYLVLSRDKRGVSLAHSKLGGIDIESHTDRIETQVLSSDTDWKELAHRSGIQETQLQALLSVFEKEYISFLEINPYVVTRGALRILDLAIEVDDAGGYFATQWTESDFRRSSEQALTAQEQTVLKLGEKSPASYKLDVINPDGSVFLLLSGGGASIVVADEVYARGYGKQLANYGEYSGNPSTEETHIYASAVLQLLLTSKARKKVLFIGGAVANFTDIANTFTGIIQAIDDVAAQLQKQKIKIYVRRGGPRQEIGLAKIEAALTKYGLLGAVHSPDVQLTTVVDKALEVIA